MNSAARQYLRCPVAQVRREIIERDFAQLLRGDAQAWWPSELDPDVRRMMTGNLDLTLSKTIERLKISVADALAFLQKDRFTLHCSRWCFRTNLRPSLDRYI